MGGLATRFGTGGSSTTASSSVPPPRNQIDCTRIHAFPVPRDCVGLHVLWQCMGWLRNARS
eukprot:3853559-Rhodomonas_salina.3